MFLARIKASVLISFYLREKFNKVEAAPGMFLYDEEGVLFIRAEHCVCVCVCKWGRTLPVHFISLQIVRNAPMTAQTPIWHLQLTCHPNYNQFTFRLRLIE